MDPDLVLERVATGGVILLEGRKSRFGKPSCGAVDGLGRLDFDTEVVHACVLAGRSFDEDELERWLGDREVGVAVAEFGRLGAEQLAIEGD